MKGKHCISNCRKLEHFFITLPTNLGFSDVNNVGFALMHRQDVASLRQHQAVCWAPRDCSCSALMLLRNKGEAALGQCRGPGGCDEARARLLLLCTTGGCMGNVMSVMS